VNAPSLAKIKERLAAVRPAGDPRARIFKNVTGPVSRALLDMLDRPGRDAAVLLALLERRDGLAVLFTERAAHLKDHAGQISFPGGRIALAEPPVQAALREAHEEIGLEPAAVQVLGELDIHLTGTGFAVRPVVGVVSGPFVPKPDPDEVAGVFEVPLEFLFDPANLATREIDRLDTRFRTFELHYAGHRIWGATAAMLITFRDIVLGDVVSNE
jgi:8-oxo-dGTP pyrophosphatase MutT (NUDIX family)